MPQWQFIHQHTTYELFFVPEQRLSVVSEAETVTGENAVIIVPPQLHHYATFSEEIAGYCLYVTLERSAKREGRLYDALTQRLRDCVTVLPMGENERFYMRQIDGARGEGETGREKISHLLPLLFTDLFCALVPEALRGMTENVRYRKYVNSLEACLARRYCEPLRLSELAEEMYLCPKQVARIIRREYGCGFSELLNRRRLSAACMYLKNTDMEIGELARRVGYEYENYFYTVFRRYYGMTPARYRKDNAEGRT